jgi:hypothetical protein
MITTAKKLVDEREHAPGTREPEPGDAPTDAQRRSGRAILRYLAEERLLRFETI